MNCQHLQLLEDNGSVSVVIEEVELSEKKTQSQLVIILI